MTPARRPTATTPTATTPAATTPAVGLAGPLDRRQLARRLLVWGVLLALAPVLLVVARAVKPSQAHALPLPNAASVPLAPGAPHRLLIGGDPSDVDLTFLAGQEAVSAVVNLGRARVEEHAATKALGITYLESAIPPGLAPTPAQLTQVRQVVDRASAERRATYLHDDTGGGRAVVTWLLLRIDAGQSPETVLHDASPAQWATMSGRQVLAVRSAAARVDRS